ncbi:MAG: exo-alpha-sialidase [Kiritimatiellae bacterium]|nr:exo-alpha-sialidase [Kiritimatiellia bacterium]
MKRIAAMVMVIGVTGCVSTNADPLSKEFINNTMPTKSVHASTIAESGDWLVTAWFGGTHEKHKDVAIYCSRRLKKDAKWSPAHPVASGLQQDLTRHPCWNPVLFQPKDGPLMLFYKVGPDPRSWWGMLKLSDDNGRTWSEARRLPETFDGPIKNKPVQLPDGSILCGSSTEFDGWRVHFEKSTDLGETWERIGPVNDGKEINAIQPSILFLGGSQLLAIGRTREKRVFSILSEDNGATWGSMTLLELPNPNSGTDAVTLKDGRHVLVYNHTPQSRFPLNVGISADGVNWKSVLTLESEKGEFSYPAVIQGSDGLLYITYTWNRTNICLAVIDPKKLGLI